MLQTLQTPGFAVFLAFRISKSTSRKSSVFQDISFLMLKNENMQSLLQCFQNLEEIQVSKEFALSTQSN